MAKYLFKSPIIFFEDEDPGFDDDGEEDEVDGSGHGGYYTTYEAWLESGYAEDYDGNGIDEDDYAEYRKRMGYPIQP